MLRIRDWETHFENSRSRVVSDLRWVPMPNHHDGERFTAFLDDPDGAAHYGCWALIIQVSSRCRPRGTLLNSAGKPLTAASIARMVRVPVAVMERAITRLLEIGWLDECQDGDGQVTGNRRASDGQVTGARHRMEWNGREEKDNPPPRSYSNSGPEGAATLGNSEEEDELQNATEQQRPDEQRPEPAEAEPVVRPGPGVEAWNEEHVKASGTEACVEVPDVARIESAVAKHGLLVVRRAARLFLADPQFRVRTLSTFCRPRVMADFIGRAGRAVRADAKRAPGRDDNAETLLTTHAAALAAMAARPDAKHRVLYRAHYVELHGAGRLQPGVPTPDEYDALTGEQRVKGAMEF